MSMIGEGVRVDAHIKDGKVRMSVNEDGEFYFRTVDHTPKTVKDTHAMLSFSGPDSTLSVAIDGAQLDALADAVNEYQDELRDRK